MTVKIPVVILWVSKQQIKWIFWVEIPDGGCIDFLWFLTFSGPCIVSIFQYISNKMQRYTVYLYLETGLHVSGGDSTHHQELIQLYLQYLVLVKPLLQPAAIVEELERNSSSSMIAASSSNGLTSTRYCR